jgi:hypothetical protein
MPKMSIQCSVNSIVLSVVVQALPLPGSVTRDEMTRSPVVKMAALPRPRGHGSSLVAPSKEFLKLALLRLAGRSCWLLWLWCIFF